MNSNRLELRAVKVTLVSGISTVLGIFLQLVTVPICLRYWGQHTFGQWITLYAAFMLMRSLDSGFIYFMGNKINLLYHENFKSMQLHLASAIYGLIAIIGIQVFIILTTFYSENISAILGISIDPQNRYEENIALLLMMLMWALTGTFTGILHRALIPNGFMYQMGWLNIVIQITQALSIVLSAIFDFKILLTALFVSLAQVISYGFSLLYIRYKLPQYYPWLSGGNVKIGIQDLVQSIKSILSNILQQGTFNGSLLLISTLAGALHVPIFSTLRTLANLWNNVTAVILSSLHPELLRHHAMRDGAKLALICHIYWLVVGTLVNFGIILTHPMLKMIYTNWTSGKLDFNEPLLCSLLAASMVAAFGGLISLHVSITNNTNISLASSIIKLILSLGIGYSLYPSIGIAGVGLGVLIGEIGLFVFQVFYFINHEIKRMRGNINSRSYLSAGISVLTVVLYLGAEAMNYKQHYINYFLSLSMVIFSAKIGWNGLEVDIKNRLINIIKSNP